MAIKKKLGRIIVIDDTSDISEIDSKNAIKIFNLMVEPLEKGSTAEFKKGKPVINDKNLVYFFLLLI